MRDNTVSAKSVVIERTVDAPVDLVWKLWTQPEHFANWYGPQGFSIPEIKIDLQVGGKRLFCMASPDGSMKMWFTGEYKEISPTDRLVYTEVMADENGNAMTEGDHATVTEVTVELEGVDGRTKMTMTHAGVPADSPGAMGWEQAFNKLTDYIKTVNS